MAAKPLTLLRREIVEEGCGAWEAGFIHKCYCVSGLVYVWASAPAHCKLRLYSATCSLLWREQRECTCCFTFSASTHRCQAIHPTILVDRSNLKLITQLANVEMQRGQVIGQFVLFWATIKGAAAGFQLSLKFKMSQLALYNFIIYNLLQINLRNIVIFHCWQIPG